MRSRALTGAAVLSVLGACALPAYEARPGGAGAAGGSGASGGDASGGLGGDAGDGASHDGGSGAGGSGPTPAWRKPITFDGSLLAETLTDFPMAVRLDSDTELSERASADGSDIRFVTAEGTTLAHDLEHYRSGDGELAAWVLIPALTADITTTIYMVYGDGEAQPSSAADVWDDRFAGVWHLSEPSDATLFADSSPVDHPGSVQPPDTAPMATDGVMAGAQSFDGNEDRIFIGDFDDFDFDVGSSFSFSAWVRQGDNPGPFDNALNNGGGASANGGFGFFLGSDSWVASISDGIGFSSPTLLADSTGLVQWVHLLAVVDREQQQMHAYKDGALVDTHSIGVIGPITSTRPLRIGGGSNSTYQGTIDEVRIYRVAVSESWARAEVLGVKADPAFVMIGQEESVPTD